MKLITDNIIFSSPDTGDYVYVGEYINDNECNITVLRFDKDDGWGKIKIQIGEDIQYLEPSSISHKTYTIQVDTKIKYKESYDNIQKIPKVIIQTHEDREFKNMYHQIATMSLQKLNPEYTYVFFNKTERREFIKTNFDSQTLEAYDTVVPGAFKADLFRYCYLYKNGGCYFDYKTIVRKPLRDIIKPEDEFLLCVDYDRQNTIDRYLNGGSYLNSVIFSAPNNENLLTMIHACVDNILHKQGTFHHLISIRGFMDILELTGPTLFYKTINANVRDRNLRFKHLITNNDETYYQNFQIVDIDTRDVLFTKTHNMWREDNHYSKLWERRELFFKNKTVFYNLLIYVCPHHFQDTFDFFIDDDTIYVERTDKKEGWGLNLIVKIIDTDTSEEEFVVIDRNRTAKIANTRVKLPTNTFLSNKLDSRQILLNTDNVVIIVPYALMYMINDIRRDIANVKIILTDTRKNIDIHELDIISKKADYVVLFNGPSCYYYCIDKNLSELYISFIISKFIKNKSFDSFKFLHANDSTYDKLIKHEHIYKYYTISNRFIKPVTSDVAEFHNLTANFVECDIIRLYYEKLSQYNDILTELNDIIYKSGEKLEGNIFYKHDSIGTYEISEEFKNKRYNMFYYSKYVYNILEIGFNGGHSTFLYLISNPHSKIQLFDLGEHLYSRKCFEFLDAKFPDRLSIVWGDSTKTVQDFKTNITYDLIHIDGGHTRYIAETDFYNCRQFADVNTQLIIDDTQCEPLSSLCNDFMKNNMITIQPLKYDTDCHLLTNYII